MNLRRLLIFAVATAFCVGCDKKSEGDPTPQTATQPTVAKPAAQKVELTLALLPQGDPKAYGAHADALAAFLEEQTGYAIEVVAAPTYADEIQAMRKGDVQVAMFAGWAYLEAHMTADASLLLAETVDGKPHVGSRWYTAKDSKLSELSDLRGKRVAFTSPSEPAGFLFPYAALIRGEVVKQGEDLKKAFGDIFFAGTDEAALRAVLDGKADAAAAAVPAFEQALDEQERAELEVLAEMENAPTRVIAVRADVKTDVQEKLKAAFLALNKPENKALLQSALAAGGLTERSHGDHVSGLAEAQELVGTEYPMPPAAP